MFINKVIMRRLSQIVNYDLQRNTFYKINKQTGQQSNTLKNGQPLKKFRPNVTGHHYLIRKHIDQDSKHPIKRLSSIETDQSHYQTLNHSHRAIKKQPKQAQTFILSVNTQPVSRHSSFTKHQENSAFLKVEVENDNLSREKSQQKLQSNIMNQTLSSYSKLLKEQVSRNNSPKKQQYAGSQTRKDPLDTLCTTISHFKIKQPTWGRSIDRKHNEIRERRQLGPQYNPKIKLSRQKAIFLEFHPEFQKKVNPKSIEIQTQRKRNLRILQQLFIRQNDKSTRKVYQSIN